MYKDDVRNVMCVACAHCWCPLRVVNVFEVVGDDVRDMQVDDPVHEIEADEADWEHDTRVLVDIRRRESVEFVEILARWDHDGCRILVDPRTVDDHAVVDDRLATDR